MIIGLGYKNQVGKSTVSNILVSQFGFEKRSFATALKELCSLIIIRKLERTPQLVYKTNLTKWAIKYGLNIESVIFEHLLYLQLPSYCFTKEKGTGKYRNLLLYVGTSMLRNNIHEDFWLDAAFSTFDVTDNIVFDDLRFKNEKKRIDQHGVTIHVKNPKVDSSDDSVQCLELARVLWDYELLTGVEIIDEEDSTDPGIVELTHRIATMLSNI
jgi:hypothetical protein